MDLKKLSFTSPTFFAVITIPCQDSSNLGECVSGIYSWSLALVGIVAFVQIVYAGWMYLTAAGNTTKTGEAMKKISNAVLGIVLLFSSYLILNTINPDLVGGSFGLPNLKEDEVERVDYGSNGSSSTTTTFFTGGSNTTTTTRGGATTTAVTVQTPLVIDSLSPTEFSRSDGPDPLIITITGSGFAPGMLIYLDVAGSFEATVSSPNLARFIIPKNDICKYGCEDEDKDIPLLSYIARGERSTDYFSLLMHP